MDSHWIWCFSIQISSSFVYIFWLFFLWRPRLPRFVPFMTDYGLCGGEIETVRCTSTTYGGRETHTHPHPNEIDEEKRRRSLCSFGIEIEIFSPARGYKFRNIKNFNLKPFTAYILIELQFYFNKMRWRNDVSLFRSDGRIELISGFHLEWMRLMLRSISPSAGNIFMMNCRESLESPSMCHKFSHSALRNPPAQRVVN